MKNVKVYTWATCPYCLKAKRLLSNKNIAFEEISIDGDRQALSDLKAQTGSGSVPQIFIDGVFIGGCDDLHALEAKGQLDDMLKDE